ncbi:hypothetical protein ACNKWM_004815 [Salmonella enterica subsp. diarizonae serovar 16:z10:e,n,x,z15]
MTVKRVRFLTKKGPSGEAGNDYLCVGESDLFHWNSTEVVTVTEQHQAEEITSFDISPANGS